MNTQEVDKIFDKVGDAIANLPGERLAGFIFRAEVSSQSVGNEIVFTSVGVN